MLGRAGFGCVAGGVRAVYCCCGLGSPGGDPFFAGGGSCDGGGKRAVSPGAGRRRMGKKRFFIPVYERLGGERLPLQLGQAGPQFAGRAGRGCPGDGGTDGRHCAALCGASGQPGHGIGSAHFVFGTADPSPSWNLFFLGAVSGHFYLLFCHAVDGMSEKTRGKKGRFGHGNGSFIGDVPLSKAGRQSLSPDGLDRSALCSMCVWFNFFQKDAAVVVYPEIEFFDSDSSFGETWKRKGKSGQKPQRAQKLQ